MSTAASVQEPPGQSPGALSSWLLAARPKTLSAASVPVVVGSACAFSLDGLKPGPALAALCGALLEQGCAIRDIRIRAPDLRDVFEAATGVAWAPSAREADA